MTWPAMDKIAARIALTDILRVTQLDVGDNERRCILLLELPYAASVELDCLTRNATDLVAAALQSRLPSTRFVPRQQAMVTATISPCTSVDDNNNDHQHSNHHHNKDEYDVDTLTAAYIRATAAQESLTDKLQRRWGKAVHDLTQIMEGQAMAEAADV